MPNLSANLSGPPFPEGAEMNADQFLAWLYANAYISLDGESLSGQINGNRPTGDNGVWFSPDGIETFQEGEYKTITDVPIGTVLTWASRSVTPPTNYLFCDGLPRSKATYAQLYAVVGDMYGSDELNFNLPPSPGRMPVFAGIPDFGLGIKGTEKLTGNNYGFPTVKNVAPYAGSPSSARGGRRYTLTPSTSTLIGTVEPPQIAFTGIIRYR